MASGVGGAEVKPQQRGPGRPTVRPKVIIQEELLKLFSGQFFHIYVPELVLLCRFLGLWEDDEVLFWSVSGG